MRKHNYLVGFKGEGNVAYGKNDTNSFGQKISKWAKLLTLGQARRMAKKFTDKTSVAINKLVEVKQPKGWRE